LEKEGTAGSGAVIHNLTAAIFAKGAPEVAYFVDYLGGSVSSIYSLLGVGDLSVTSRGGRNTRMGCLLDLGMPYLEAKATQMPEDTIEGTDLAFAIGPAIMNLVKKGDLSQAILPLLLKMVDIVMNNAPVVFPWNDFLAWS
jgi:glycerol-3-phosphate dehydrogenase (NAD(P)+)